MTSRVNSFEKFRGLTKSPSWRVNTKPLSLRPRKPGVHQLAAAALPPEERSEYWRKAMEEKRLKPGAS